MILFSCQSKKQDTPHVEEGAIDLSEWDFEREGNIQLDGEWGFYWGSLLTKKTEIESAKHSGKCLLPRFWTEVAFGDTYFEQNGVATYHLKLILPDTVQDYSLKLNAVFTSYALWEEGGLLASVGQVGNSPETTIQNFESKLVELPKKRELNLFLQVASWEHTRGGGVVESITLGKTAQIHQLWLNNFIEQIIACAIILGIALYLIVLAFYYPENPGYLYVGLFAILGAIRAICVDEMIIEDIFNNFPYYLNQRFRYIGFFAGIGFYVLAVNEFFKGYVSKYVLYGAYSLFVYSVSTFILPFSFTSYLSPYFQLVAVVMAIFCFYYILRSIIDKNNIVEAVIFMIGGLVAFSTMIHYLLYVSNIVQGKLYHNLGYTVFIFSQILILAYRTRRTYDKANALATDLSILNKDLEQKVEIRTKEIEAQKDKIVQQATELSIANDKLTALDKAKDRFFANISHELRTPLTLILGGTSKVKKNLQEKNKGISLIEQQSNLLNQLINQLLDLTKSEAGKMGLQMATQPLVKLFRDLFYSFQPLADVKQISLEFSTNVDEFYALVDHEILRKIIYNLLSNAYKFTPESGRITLDVNIDDGYFKLVITDSGIGIPKEKQPLIFDKFYQADTSMNKEYQGTGIGLALVKELVELHEGRIEVTSTVGKGSSFTLKFPLHKSQPINQQEALSTFTDEHVSLPLEAHSSQNTKVNKELPIILIVEDHPDLQNLIIDELQGKYQVLKANDGLIGVEMAFEHIPDIIVSDVMMPKKDGYELCEIIKTDERTSHIPVMLLTARTAKENKLQGLRLGADDYLGKPFDSDELQIRVKNLLQNRKLLQRKFIDREEVFGESLENIFENETSRGFMDKLFALFHEHYSNSDFGLMQIADSFNMSKRQVQRKLGALSDMTPNKLLQQYRLGKSKELLAQEGMKAKDVWFQVGFSSHSYFNKRFKEQFGMTPKDFQNSLQI